MSFKDKCQGFWQFLTSKWLVTAIGLITLSLLIWFGGPLLGIAEHKPLASVTARILVLVFIVFVVSFIFLISKLKEKKANDEVVNNLLNIDKSTADDEVSEKEIKVLQERVQNAIDILKNSKFTKGKSVYQLPWYIMLGPPGAGKTTAISQSGLNFPLRDKMGADPIQGIAGTRHCDWWFTDKAILIDTAGRYTSQDSHAKRDARAWQGFLGLLKKYRPRRPINGLIINMSMPDLLQQTRTERNLKARSIKQRVLELQHQLGMSFPVYVMLGKADLMAGFREFFDDLGREERDQVWGITFDLQTRFDERGTVGHFNKEFHGLLTRLNQRLYARLQYERDPEKREHIYEFPKQLRLFQAAADEFLKEIFSPNAFEEAPLLRGVYMSSSIQEGIPIDNLQTHLDGGLQTGANSKHQANENKGFFIKRLLEEVIFPEKNLASTNQHHVKQNKTLRYASLFIGIVSTVLLSSAWYLSYNWNSDFIAQSQKGVDTYQDISGGGLSDRNDIVSLTMSLTELQHLPAGFSGQIPEGSITDLGLYQADKFGEQATAAYQRALQEYLAPYLLVQLSSEIQSNDNNLNYLYETLKTYLMLFDDKHFDLEQVTEWFMFHTERKILPGEINEPIRQELNGHIVNLLALGFNAQDLDKNTVAQARKSLTMMPLVERAYQRIRGEYLHSDVPDFKLSNVLGEQSIKSLSFQSGKPINSSISGLYTYNGFHGIFHLESSRILKHLINDSWVYGDDVSSLDEADRKKITAQVQDKYFRDYIYLWQNMLDDLQLKSFATADQGSQRLKLLAGNEAPILSIIQAVQKNVKLSKLPVSDNMKAAGDLASKQSTLGRLLPQDGAGFDIELPGKTVEKAFSGILSLELDKLAIITANLKAQERYLHQISQPDADLKVAYTSQDKLKNLNRELTQLSRELPQPFAAWLMNISESTDSINQTLTKTHINEVWRSIVVKEYMRTIKGRYPFNNRAKVDVKLKDFSKFFAYGGIMDQFFAEYIAPSVDTTRSPWRFEKNIGLNSSSLEVFQDAQQIRNVFFEPGGNKPKVDFWVRPISLDRFIGSFMLELDGKQLIYRHDPQRPTQFTWPSGVAPGSVTTGNTRLVFTPPGGGRAVIKNYDGEWSIFKMLDDVAAKRPETKSDKVLHIAIKGNHAQVKLLPSSADHPFWNKNIEQFSCPNYL